MYALTKSPFVALNRVIPTLKVKGAQCALEEIAVLRGNQTLKNHYLLAATEGEIHLENGASDRAMRCFNEAKSLTNNPQEKFFFDKKMSGL